MDLTSAGNTVMGGVYVGPYTATIDGVSTSVICDDFFDDSSIGDLWTANIVAGALASTSNTAMDQKYNPSTVYGGLSVGQAYDAVGYLATQMLAATDATTIGEYDFALWSIFDYTGAIDYGKASSYNPLSVSQLGQIDQFLEDAKAYVLTSSDPGADIASFTVYSPINGGPPQEFLVHTPEPASFALLGIDLSCAFGLIFFLRRRSQRHTT